MRVLVIGANGHTGTLVTKRLAGADDLVPRAMIRDAGQAGRFEEMGVETVVADLEESIDHAVEGCDAVIFAAGSGSKTGPDKTIAVDQEGAMRSMDAAQRAGAARYVMLSSMGADPRSEGHRISHYYRAKGKADDYLRGSELRYTIVRPGRLTHEQGKGTVEAASEIRRRGTIPREDVAEVLVESLRVPETEGKSFDLLEGPTPIADALRQL